MTNQHLSRLVLAVTGTLILSGCNSSFVLKGDEGQNTTQTTTITEQGSTAEQTDSAVVQDTDAQESKQAKQKDLWQRVRKGFKLKTTNNRQITKHVDWYERHDSYIKRLQKRSKPYIHFILEQADIQEGTSYSVSYMENISVGAYRHKKKQWH